MRPTDKKVIILFLLAAMPGCSGDAPPPANQKDQVSTPISATSPDAETSSSAYSRPPASPQPSAIEYDNIAINLPIMHRKQAGDPDAGGWCVAESTRGNFTVALPGRYDDYMLKSKTPAGGFGVLHTVKTKHVNGTEFNVLQTEILGHRPPETLSAVETMIERFEKQGAKVLRRPVTIGLFAADRLSVRAPGVAAEMVLLTRKSSDYMIAVQWKPGVAEDIDEDIEKFFSSFEITHSDK